MGGHVADPSMHWVRAVYTLNCSTVHHRATSRDKQPFKLPPTPVVFSVNNYHNLTCFWAVVVHWSTWNTILTPRRPSGLSHHIYQWTATCGSWAKGGTLASWHRLIHHTSTGHGYCIGWGYTFEQKSSLNQFKASQYIFLSEVVLSELIIYN